jgi:hypothetical protein
MSKAGSRPMSRTGCVVSVLVWLCVMTVPFLALLLAMRGELTWRRGEFVEDRLWLVNAETGIGRGSASGIGYSASRVISDDRAADGPVCARTSVYFFLWQGKSESVSFCECYQPVEGGGYEAQGNCP